MIICDFVIEDDNQKTIYGSGGVIKSELLDVTLVREVMTRFYKQGKHAAFDVQGNEQRPEVLADAKFVDDYQFQYPEVSTVISLLDEMHKRGERSHSAASASLDLLRVYSKSLKLI